MTKVKVSKELANALNIALADNGYSFTDLVDSHACKIENCDPWKTVDFKPFNNLTLREMCEILFNGYETEITAHDIIKDDWEHKTELYKYANAENKREITLLKNQILFILNTLGEKIEGVNR